MSATAALATFWVALAVLAALAAAGRTRMRWAWSFLLIVAGGIAIMTSGICILIPLGLALGAVGTGRLYGELGVRSRMLIMVGLALGLVLAFRLTVWNEVLPAQDLPAIGIAGIAVGLGGLVVAAACQVVETLRPLAVATVPMLLAALWPGPTQAPAMLLAITFIAVETGFLLDHPLRLRRPPADMVVGTVSLLAAVVVAVFLLPLPTPEAPTVTPTEEVTLWLSMQLSPDSVIEVDPLTRAQLVRNGLDPARLSAASGPQTDADFVLAPLAERAGLPLIARFASDAGTLGLRLVVADPVAYSEAMVTDQAARGQFGTTLAANSNLILGSQASAALRGGDVDSRLMVGLCAAAAADRFGIEEFTGTGSDPGTGRIFREVTVSDITSLGPAAPGSTATHALAEFFRGLDPPFFPLAVAVSGSTVIVRYPAPAPFGLLA